MRINYCPECGSGELLKDNVIMASQTIKICPYCNIKFSVDTWDITEEEQKMIDECYN